MNHLGKIALYLLLAAHALPPLPTLKLEKDEKEKEGVNKNEKCSSPWQVSKTIDSTVQYSTIQLFLIGTDKSSTMLRALLSPDAEPFRLALTEPSSHVHGDGWREPSTLKTGGERARFAFHRHCFSLHSGCVFVSDSCQQVGQCRVGYGRAG